MRFGKTGGLVVLLALACAGMWPGVARPQATTAPANAFSDDLKKRLASTDPTVRQAAERELAGIAGMLSDPEILQKLADAAGDAQAAAMLRQRIAQLRAAQAATVAATAPNGDLPPISLSVKSAMLTEVVGELNKALKGDNPIQVPAGSAGPFTLEVREKPFWEVFTALQSQQPFYVLATSTRVSLSTGAAMNPRPYAIDGPMITYITGISYRRTMDLQAMPGPTAKAGEFTISILQALDPRLSPTTFGAAVIFNAVDDRGQQYGALGAGAGSTTGVVRSQSVPLSPPARPGKTISFTLDSSVGASPAGARAIAPSPTGPVAAVIEDVEKHIGDTVAVPGGSLRLAPFDTTGPQIRMQLSFQSGGATSLPRAYCTLLDGAGARVWAETVTATTSMIGSRSATGPFKLEIRTPTAPGGVAAGARKFHFEFKDIVLP